MTQNYSVDFEPDFDDEIKDKKLRKGECNYEDY